MDRRRPILVNQYEVATHEALKDAAARCQAQVFAKVRLADALDVERSGLGHDEYSYALKAHFDFVVQREKESVAFAVEFDGRKHDLDPKAVARDALKNAVCEKLGMPLLRIDAAFLRKVGRFSVLGWLAEVWFLHEDFCAAQAQGQIPYDEVFHYSFILGLAFRGERGLREIDFADARSAVKQTSEQSGELIITRPYDPFLPSRALLRRLHDRGVCQYPPEILHGRDPQGYWHAYALVGVDDGRTVIGMSRCRPFRFPPVTPYELSAELAVLNAAENVELYRRGQYEPATPDEVASLQNRLARWKSYG
jgi:hypothetical protein